MSDTTNTDPYNGELPDDADLGSASTPDPEHEDAADDVEAALPGSGDESGLKTDGSGPLP
jgi:hypothetical protein